MPDLNEDVMGAFRDELRKLAAGEMTPYAPEQMAQLHGRFGELTNLLKEQGVYAGTGHKRIVIPKDKLTETDVHSLGFRPVTIAIPEAGQDRFQSFRHPDMNYHIHSHPEGWTMHEDQHAASTMLAAKAKGLGQKTKALVQGIPHVNEEGIPGLYYYVKGRLQGHASTAQRVLSEESEELKSRLNSLAPSWSHAKQAGWSGAMAQRLRNTGAGLGMGSLLGAGLGGVATGRTAYQQAKSEGSDGLGALGSGLSAGMRGAATGGLLGAGLGGAFGARTGIDLTQFGKNEGALAAGARFGQRQVHSLTGMLTPEELRGVRGGSWNARQAMHRARDKAEKAVVGLNRGQAARATAHLGDVQQRLQAAEKAEDKRLTSIPGYLKALREDPAGTLRTSWDEQRYGQPRSVSLAMVGLPAALAARRAVSGEEYDDRGEGRGAAVGRHIGSVVGNIAGGMMPLAGNLIAGKATSEAGALLGRGIDRLRGVKRQAPPIFSPGPPERDPPEQGQTTPTERITTPAAAGRAPEFI